MDIRNNKKYKKLSALAATLVLGYGAVCLAITLIAPEVLAILAPASYKDGVYVVPPIASASFLAAFYNLYANIEFYHKKPFYIAVSTIIATLANLVINFLLIPKFSYVGAAYATLISYVILIFMHFIGYKRCSGKERIYNSKLLALIGIVVIACCLLSNLLYTNIMVRYAIILLIAVLALIKHKTIINKIKALYAKEEET